MMDHELITKQLTKWIIDFVEKPNPLLNNWPPCPYARQARINNKLEIIESHFGNLVNDVNTNLNLLDDKDVVVVWFDHNAVDPVTLSSLVKAYNNILMPKNYVILEDHPDSLEFVNGLNMNFGLCGLLIVSKLSVLNTASDQLRSKGYYDHWDQKSLSDVVNWRFHK